VSTTASPESSLDGAHGKPSTSQIWLGEDLIGMFGWLVPTTPAASVSHRLASFSSWVKTATNHVWSVAFYISEHDTMRGEIERFPLDTWSLGGDYDRFWPSTPLELASLWLSSRFLSEIVGQQKVLFPALNCLPTRWRIRFGFPFVQPLILPLYNHLFFVLQWPSSQNILGMRPWSDFLGKSQNILNTSIFLFNF